MELIRYQEKVSFFHYDTRNFEFEATNGAPETRIYVRVHVLDEAKDKGEADSAVQINLSALVVLDDYVLSASLIQDNVIKSRLVSSQADLNQGDMETLARPLFDLLKRLSYEVTEIALDQPGLKLEF